MPEHLTEYLFAVTIFCLIPGANTMMTIKNSVRGGFIDGTATSAGIGAGFFIHAAVSTCGLALILYHSAQLYHAIKFCGAAYIIWMGIQSLRNAIKNNVSGTDQQICFAQCSIRKSFTEGIVFNILNPKTCIFYMAFLPQFMDANGNLLLQACILAGVHCTIFLCWQCAIAGFVHKAKALISKAKVRSRIDTVAGVALIGLGVELAVSD
ncbi:LysE family translocator [Halodesulfovibrio aestuarii]|uniref:Threonine/homoserine/homoserine lactone efflux protein n=1 Tax=Halodesulfovibrio aestuarii TaxID=126333 RepID=A0A8G2CC00_9BACT|nr:LysE family translocator [Halodesulfovibrio aestuarii]SHJ47385.1 Threonine/homoserine/homoserine lactone efflux protein [Halodesulfovibrio aestuarii]